MKKIKLNYNYRFPRVWFKNGISKYGILYKYYDKVKRKLDYYFAEANEVRRLNLPKKNATIEVLRGLKNKVNPQDVVKVEYQN